MKAVVYNSSSLNGIKMVDSPPTTMTYFHSNISLFYRFCYCFYFLFGILFKLMRLLFTWMPAPYGENPNRKFVLSIKYI